jgi:hypothetical protein
MRWEVPPGRVFKGKSWMGKGVGGEMCFVSPLWGLGLRCAYTTGLTPWAMRVSPLRGYLFHARGLRPPIR